MRLLLLLLLLPGCAFCDDSALPCASDANCPSALPSCVAGVCVVGEGEGEEGEGEEGEGEEGEGEGEGDVDVDITVLPPAGGFFTAPDFAEAGDRLYALWSDFPEGVFTEQPQLGELGTTGELARAPVDVAGLRVAGVAGEEDEVFVAGSVDGDNVVAKREVGGAWSAAAPGPAIGFGSGFVRNVGDSLVAADGSISGIGIGVGRGTLGETWNDEVIVSRSASRAILCPRRGLGPAVVFTTPDVIAFLPFVSLGETSEPMANLRTANDAFCVDADEAWIAGEDDDGRPLLVRVDDDLNPIDLISEGAAEAGDSVVAVVKDGRGVLHAVVRRPIDAERSDLFLINDDDSPWNSERLGRVGFDFVRVALVVAPDGTRIVGVRGQGPQAQDIQFDLYRRAAR